MPDLSRREALRLCGVTLSGAVAGCSTGSRESSDPTLGELDVSNHDFRSYAVSVLFLDDDEPVYHGERTATPAEPETADSSEVARLGGATFEDAPTDVGDYVLYAWRDDQPVSEWRKFDFREHDSSCIGLMVQIGDTTSRTGEVSIWYTNNPERCPAKATTASE
ncbi:hypothetical protein [Halorussus halobius]|uniref:hypothetical protein n=1 Tax=Halorussus halobius TaxID=1710537 RepID=UPI001091CE7C|nr:hypothetical protein [Halorussus halobius]